MRCRAILLVLFAMSSSCGVLQAQQPAARQLVDLANRDRAAAGLPALKWDPALAAAAYDHALRMAQEGPISHRYGGEPDLAERAAAAGARFSLIEENIAIGDSPAQVHDAWMRSPGHNANLLNSKIDRIGVALVPAHGVLYAVADYAQGVASLTVAEVEAQVGAVLTARGLKVSPGRSAARLRCAHGDGGAQAAGTERKPRFVMLWQSAQIDKLPERLEKQIATGTYQEASVGACSPQNDAGAEQAAFTAYRVAVLLY